jgi:hypothetical protein
MMAEQRPSKSAVVWTHPAFAHRSAFVRNNREIIRVDVAEGAD